MIIFNLFRRFRYPVVRQYEQSDCGPASLLSILKFHGGDDSIVHMREICGTNSSGTTMFDIVKAAKTIGFKAKGVKGEYQHLLKESLPGIAHLTLEQGRQHYAVVYGINSKRILIGDPAKGLISFDKESFENLWKSKTIVLLEPNGKLFYHKPAGWIKWVTAYTKRENIWIFQTFFLGIIYTILGLMTAFFIQWLIDDVIPANNIRKIGFIGGFLFLILTMRAFIGYLRDKFLVILNQRVSITINADFIEHLFHLPKKFFDSRKKGDITARIHDTLKIQQAIIRFAGSTFIDLLIILCSTTAIFYFSPFLAWLVLCLIPAYVLILILYTRPIKNQQNNVMKGFAKVESTYIDSLEGIEDILGFNAAKSFTNTNKLVFHQFQDQIKKLGYTRTSLSFLADISGTIITIVILILGAMSVVWGSLKLGQMIACYSLVSYIIPAINRSVEANIVLQGASVASKRLLDLMLAGREKNSGKAPFKMKKALMVKGAEFSWSSNHSLFNGIDMQIPKGQIVSLWGPSGAGKSTLSRILQRKYSVGAGQIFLDDQPVENITLHEYRQNIAVVPQDIKIFNGTLADNILLGRPTSSLLRLNRILNDYGLSKFYNNFEHGLYTQIGEDGRQLSGGEKQMLGLTRALFDEPMILILDEGLNALDMKIEKLIFSILSSYSNIHAVLINTHNLRIIMKTDFLYVINKGQVIQRGRPINLLQEKGYFREVFAL